MYNAHSSGKAGMQMVGLGVAMGNAVDKARQAADVQVASNDDEGVAEALERFILKPAGVLTGSPAP